MRAAVSATPCNLNGPSHTPSGAVRGTSTLARVKHAQDTSKMALLVPRENINNTSGSAPSGRRLMPKGPSQSQPLPAFPNKCWPLPDPPGKNVEPASLFTAFGKTHFHFRSGRDLIKGVCYPASHENDGFGSRGVIVTAGGANGNDPSMEAGPHDLYKKLGREAPQRFGISVVHLQYREPNSVTEAVKDVLAVLNYIRQASTDALVPPVLLFGWSMGGAAVVQAAVQFLEQQKNLEDSRRLDIRGIVTIAGQPVLDDFRSSSGAALLPLECGLTICHGSADPSVNIQAADMLYKDAIQGPAGPNKPNLDLKKFPGEGHGVVSVYNWLMHGRLPPGTIGKGNFPVAPVGSGQPHLLERFGFFEHAGGHDDTHAVEALRHAGATSIPPPCIHAACRGQPADVHRCTHGDLSRQCWMPFVPVNQAWLQRCQGLPEIQLSGIPRYWILPFRAH